MTSYPARSDGRIPRLTRGWALAGPGLLLMAVVLLVPLAAAIHTSLYRSRLAGPDSFVGTDHYTALLGSAAWWLAVASTLAIAALISLGQVALGFVIAATMHYAPRIRRSLALAVLIPFAALPYAWTYSWFAAFDGGWIATWFALDGLGAGASLTAVVVAETWRGVGLAAVICSIGLHRVSPRLLESARADGARMWHRLTRVTLPAAVPALAIAYGLRLLDTVRLFDPVVVARDYPGATQPDALAAALFRSFAERGELGVASAAGVLTIALTVATVLVGWLIAAGIVRLRAKVVR